MQIRPPAAAALGLLDTLLGRPAVLTPAIAGSLAFMKFICMSVGSQGWRGGGCSSPVNSMENTNEASDKSH